MQKTLYLHIGTEKTGSTTLQAVSGINRSILMNQGIFYPKTPGERSHIKLTLFAANGQAVRDLRRIARLFPDEAYNRFKANFAEQLTSEVLASECSRIYLSNEHLSSRLKTVQEVSRLASIVRPLADSVKVVVYLRPQVELYLSSCSTAIKAGITKSPEPPSNGEHPRYNYEKMLSRWADNFGEENVIVRIYDRNTLIGRDVVKDFFSIMGYEPGADIKIPADLNLRLDRDALGFLMEFNKYIPQYLEGSVNPDRGDIAIALAKISGTGTLSIAASVRRNIDRTFEESNARVARRFLGRLDGKLFADVDDLEDKGAQEGSALTVQRAVEIAADLWRRKRRHLELVKRKVRRLEAKLASTRKPS